MLATKAIPQLPSTFMEQLDGIIGDIRAGNHPEEDPNPNGSSSVRDIGKTLEEMQQEPTCMSCGQPKNDSNVNCFRTHYEKSAPEPEPEPEPETLADVDGGFAEEPVRPAYQVIELDSRATRIIRESLDQIKFLEGKIKGLIEVACLDYPGEWVLSPDCTKLESGL